MGRATCRKWGVCNLNSNGLPLTCVKKRKPEKSQPVADFYRFDFFASKKMEPIIGIKPMTYSLRVCHSPKGNGKSQSFICLHDIFSIGISWLPKVELPNKSP